MLLSAMGSVLICWIGKKDQDAAAGKPGVGTGPIARALAERPFTDAVLLFNESESEIAPYLEWLRSRTKTKTVARHCPLSSPTHYGEIYEAARTAVAWAIEQYGDKAKLTFHLSPGTPAMASIWIILAKSQFEAELIESSEKAGVQAVQIPFEISAEFLPTAVRRTEERLEKLSTGLAPEAPVLADILHRSKAMADLLDQARQVAIYKQPVLILGESGTGKELLARAIHGIGPRVKGPFVPVNCGAISPELVESEFFGHKKGSFTGADRDRLGHFEQANGGTLFLDEIGELPRTAQPKLLRALQEKQITRVGESHPRAVDVRVIAATNRDLREQIRAGAFREDLFYRLAVLLLRCPPLREREGDVGLLAEKFLERLNAESGEGVPKKKLSPAARNMLLRHAWPGNVRELEGVLVQAHVWARGTMIEEADMRAALSMRTSESGDRVLGRPLGNGFSLDDTLAEVARHYLARAFKESGGHKTKAAELVGFKSYQRYDEWVAKYSAKN